MPKLTDFVGAMDAYVSGDDDMLGAPAPRRGLIRRPTSAPRRMVRPPVVQQAVNQMAGAQAGQPRIGPKIEPLGWPTFTFNATSGTVLTLVTRPQKRFKGSKLIIPISRNGPTSTAAVLIGRLMFGAVPILVNGNPISADAYPANGQGNEMMLPEVVPGIDVELQLLIVGAAITMTDSIVVVPMVLGMTIGDVVA